MKKGLICFLGAVLVLGTVASAQSLADVARASRTSKKRAAHVYTNDDLGATTPAPPDSKDADKTDQPPVDDSQKPPDAEDPAKKVADPDAETKRIAAEFRTKIEDQQRSVNLLERELQVLQHEFQIQTTVYYSDAGNRLRDPKDWVETRKRYEDGIEEKKKALAEARVKLEDIQEQARKANVAVKTGE